MIVSTEECLLFNFFRYCNTRSVKEIFTLLLYQVMIGLKVHNYCINQLDLPLKTIYELLWFLTLLFNETRKHFIVIEHTVDDLRRKIDRLHE